MDGQVLSVLTANPEEVPGGQRPAGEPVVLLHGVPTGAELWREVAGRLAAAGRRVLAPDLPGYGHTRLSFDADHSLAGAAELLAAWLEDTGLAPVWLVGHDLGGGVAQIVAVRRPELVAAVSLTNAVVDDRWPVGPMRLARLVARAGIYPALTRLRLVVTPYLSRQLRRAFADPHVLTRQLARRVFFDGKVVDPCGRRAFARHLAALTNADTRAVAGGLAGLAAPGHVVWGVADPFLTWEVAGRWLVELLGEPPTSLLPGCGHFTPLECPDRLADALLEWRGSHT